MSPEIRRNQEPKKDFDIVDVGIGVGTAIGLFIAGTELIKVTDVHSVNAVQIFVDRIITVIGVSLGATAAMYTSSRIRHK
ncbi:hypothetical protein HY502_01240 [Candidatus Woesebacteria bacterium]|nr:hypothetical protein [Candidatus Woesebacteria bacterium]